MKKLWILSLVGVLLVAGGILAAGDGKTTTEPSCTTSDQPAKITMKMVEHWAESESASIVRVEDPAELGGVPTCPGAYDCKPFCTKDRNSCSTTDLEGVRGPRIGNATGIEPDSHLTRPQRFLDCQQPITSVSV